MKLLSMTDFVLEQDKKASQGGHYNRLVRYANFLKQPLKLEMFVPCDEEGKPYKENPAKIAINNGANRYVVDELDEKYLKAKEKVLFEGFSVRKQSTYEVVSKADQIIWLSWNNSKTVESIMKMTDEIFLTPSALKQIGL